MFSRLLIGILLATALSGCASMINHYQDRAEVFGPRGITATNREGDTLRVYQEDDRQFVSLPTFDTFITFHNGKASERVLLQRSFSPWTLLDIETLGIGFPIDDAIGGWQRYDDLYVYLDSSSGTDTTLQATNPNFWQYEARPRLLIAGAWGVNSLNSAPAGDEFWVPPYYEYAIGVSYRHQWEAFYRGSTSFDVGLTPASALQYNGHASISSFIARIYPWSNLFIEAGPSFINLSTDSAYFLGSYSASYPPASASLTAISAGLGWSGDFSYIEWNYEYGLKSYSFFEQPARQFREFVVTVGLIFRI
ncbi:MAG TPA: hypothetical protein VFH95_10675 [Candidatus Kapabacteria bacterium]|nr:hypothetical protein [Candidatus Kapabacteria bacterium]